MKQNIIIIAVALTALAAVFFLVFDMYLEGEKKSTLMFREHEYDEIHHIAHRVGLYFSSISEGIQSLAAVIAGAGRDPVRIQPLVRSYLAYVNCMHLKSVSVCDRNGKIIYSSDQNLDGLDFSGCAFLKWAGEPITGKRVFISYEDYAPNRTGPCLGLTITTPLYEDSGEYAGAVVAAIDLREMLTEEIISSGPKTELFKIWVINETGTVLYNFEHPEMASRNIYSKSGCSRCHESFEFVKDILAKKEGSMEYSRKSDTDIMAYATMDFANASWTIVTNVPYSEMEAVTKSSLHNTLLLISVLAFVFIGSFVFIFRNNMLKVKAEEHAKQLADKLRFEEKLIRSEERYKRLFEESPNAVFVSTPEGKFIDINSAGISLFGYASRDEMLKIDIVRDIYCNPGDRDRLVKLLEEHGVVKDHELEFKHKDGRRVIVLETATAVRDNGGKITEIHGIMQDITERKQLERQLLYSQKMESIYKLAGGIAHDFNNIMGIILGYTLLLEQDKNDPEKFSQDINAITKAVKRGTSLTRQILTFARKADTLFEPVDVNVLVDELTKMISATFPKVIVISVRVGSGVPLIRADYNQLHQVLLNLCLNARDAMLDPSKQGPEGGTLVISTDVVHGVELREKFSGALDCIYVRLAVSDTGTGMDEHIKSRIFEPFFTTKEMRQGTGLGLAVVYGIVQIHNGYISVDSVPGQGSTFTIYLPVEEGLPLPVTVAGAEKQEVKGGSETVLVVEDEDNLLRLLEIVLENKGYKVLSAKDGREAVEIYSGNREDIDIVLTDMGLPRLDGAGLISVLKTLNPNLKIIIASGYFEIDLKTKLLDLGVKEFIQKPYVLDEVLRKIRCTIDGNS